MCKWGNEEILEYNGKRFTVDSCIVPIVKALNGAGIRTIASCCGHGKMHGDIALADGRELLVVQNFDEARKYDQFGLDMAKMRPQESEVKDIRKHE